VLDDQVRHTVRVADWSTSGNRGGMAAPGASDACAGVAVGVWVFGLVAFESPQEAIKGSASVIISKKQSTLSLSFILSFLSYVQNNCEQVRLSAVTPFHFFPSLMAKELLFLIGTDIISVFPENFKSLSVFEMFCREMPRSPPYISFIETIYS
jgi:hypothetical protein